MIGKESEDAVKELKEGQRGWGPGTKDGEEDAAREVGQGQTMLGLIG